MIDLSPLLLWSVDDVLELLPMESADHPHARRLAVLAAEAHAAGHERPVLTWFCEVAEVLLVSLPASSSRSALAHTIDVTQRALTSNQPLSTDGRILLRESCELEATTSCPEGAATSALAAWALGILDELRPPATHAWQTATELLAAVVQAAGSDAESAIARCAALAHNTLFLRSVRQRTEDCHED